MIFLDFSVSQILLRKRQEKVQLRFLVNEARLTLASAREALKLQVKLNFANKYKMFNILLRKERGKNQKIDIEKLDGKER